MHLNFLLHIDCIGIHIYLQFQDIDKSNPPDAFVVLYSVVDKASFLKAEDELTRLHDADLLRSRPAIIVGNKIDLARSRAVSTQGTHYIFTSALSTKRSFVCLFFQMENVLRVHLELNSSRYQLGLITMSMSYS